MSLGPLAAGLGKGYSSPAIASLQDLQIRHRGNGNYTSFTVTDQEASWVASLTLLGNLSGTMHLYTFHHIQYCTRSIFQFFPILSLLSPQFRQISFERRSQLSCCHHIFNHRFQERESEKMWNIILKFYSTLIFLQITNNWLRVGTICVDAEGADVAASTIFVRTIEHTQSMCI